MTLWPRIRRNRAKGGKVKGGGYTNQGPAGIIHPAEYYFRDKAAAERWKAAHPEAYVYYGTDDEGWVEV